MERTQHGQRPNVQELQNAGGDVQRLSSIVVATRHAYWQQARAVLNEEQQSTIDHLVSKATLRDLQ